MKIFIKNMVCPRCITAVGAVFMSMGFTVDRLSLGEAVINECLSEGQLRLLADRLRKEGLELLNDPRSCLVEQVRIGVMEWVRMKGPRPKLSDYISGTVHRDYSSLSKLFSQVKGVTIECFAIRHRTEYAKELLSYGQQSVCEIAYALGYSSPAHLTSQFKQQTGMSPREFRKLKTPQRLHLDEL